MSKFKADMIKGAGEGLKVGAGLLNEVSKEQAINRREIEYIDMDKIHANPNNKYSVDGIEDLAQAIYMAGELEQPIILKPYENNEYMLTTGERRWKAIQLLRDQGKWKYDNLVPAIVKDPNEVNLPLDEETKEMFSILITNQYREKTDADMFMEIQEWKKIFASLKAAGVEVAPFGAGGEEVTIKGEKTRNLVAQQMNLSPAQVGRFEKLDNQGSDPLVKAVLDNQITLPAAEKAMELEEADQKRLVEGIKEEKPTKAVGTKEIQEKIKKVEAEILLDKEIWHEQVKKIEAKLESGSTKVKESEYKKIQSAIVQVEKILGC